MGQFEEVVFGFLSSRGLTADAASWRNQICGGVGRAANFAGVAVLIFALTLRTRSQYKAIWQKHFVVFTVGLLDLSDLNVAFFLFEPILHVDECCSNVCGRGSCVDIRK